MPDFRTVSIESVLSNAEASKVRRYDFWPRHAGIKLPEDVSEWENLVKVLEIVKNLQYGDKLTVERHEPEHHFDYTVHFHFESDK